MAAQSDITNMALFCDFENIALGVRDAKYAKFDIDKVLERLFRAGVKPVVEKRAKGPQTLAGETIVFTGTLESMSRPEAQRKAEARGARGVEAVPVIAARLEPGEIGVHRVRKRGFGPGVAARRDHCRAGREIAGPPWRHGACRRR